MTKYFFGVAGWSYKDWAGIVYPTAKGKGFDPLSYLAQYFDTIELNNTFYRIPESKVVDTWAKRVSGNSRFRFTAKLWEGFTHDKKEILAADIKLYKKAMAPLVGANRLGSVLMQFPISFKNEPSSRERLAKLAEYFKEYFLVVEFRHRSWVHPQMFDWLEELGVGYCNVDEPKFREMIKPSSIVTSKTAYVRKTDLLSHDTTTFTPKTSSMIGSLESRIWGKKRKMCMWLETITFEDKLQPMCFS
jgi:uncharacterized protein YecE (DUF72 family)